MSVEDLPEHSPLGASSAERWMNCTGSAALIAAMAAAGSIPIEDEEPDYRADGTATHTVIEKCLDGGLQPWELIGEVVAKREIKVEHADGAQVFLDEINRIRVKGAKEFIEYGISAPHLHKYFYGRLDYAQVYGNTAWIRDYKNGVGVVVEVKDNPQCMYYAYGLSLDFPDVEQFDLGIVQPNALHEDGAVRNWVVSREVLRHWAETEMLPKMQAAFDGEEKDFVAGKWCRFCPAKLMCPVMRGLTRAALLYTNEQVITLSDRQLGEEYALVEQLKMIIKALEEETYARLLRGADMTGLAKLVTKRADRVWKPEAAEVFSALPGAMTVPVMVSPAVMEKLGPEVKAKVRQFAYTPETGLTVAKWNDKRAEMKIQSTTEIFGAQIAQEHANV